MTIQKDLKLRTGNQMIAEGAIHSGCRFFAGYPITPASGIYKSMLEMLQERGDLAVSSPDEISAIAYCVGASMRGFKSMTATSGPGWALMIETVQYALMTETPLVIAHVQRLGPSTGSATQGGQGDILLIENCTSGGYTIPVLCPSTPAECFELTVLAFSWAERLRTPVVLLTDKEIGMSLESVDYKSLQPPPVETRKANSKLINGTNGQRTYDFKELSDVPLFAPVGGDIKVTATGSAHNKSGDLKKNDSETLEVLHHLEEKIAAVRKDLVVVNSDLVGDADTLVISYGITARTMAEAVIIARKNGKKVSSMNVMSLFPIPEDILIENSRNIKRIVVAEENLTGQYRSVIASLFSGKEVIGVNKIGAMITPDEILSVML